MKTFEIGDQVVVQWGWSRMELSEVIRVTATQAIISSGDRYRRYDGSEVGDRYRSRIEHATEEHISRIRKAKLVSVLKNTDWSIVSLDTLERIAKELEGAK
jgi:hypothetical protein